MEKMENITGRSEENGRSERRISIDELIKSLTFNITSEPHVGSPSNDPLFTEDSCPNWTPPRSDTQSFATGNTHSNPFYSYPSFGNLFSRGADTDSSNSNLGSDRYFSYYSNIDSLLNTFELPLRNSHKETQASYADIVNGWMNYLPFGASSSSTPPRPPSTPSPSSTPPLSRTPDLGQNESVFVDGNTQCKTESSVKLSYSDVASIPPSPTVQSKLLKSKLERTASIAKPAFIPKKVKSRQQHANVTTTNTTRLCNRIVEDIPNSIKPNAKYGLDSFENLPEKPHKLKREHKRKNSLDSMSSDRSSGQDENQPANKFSGIHDLGEEMVDSSINNKTRNKKDRDCDDHLFFDPRRIFAGYKILGSNAKATSLTSPLAQQDRSRKNEPALNNRSDKPSTQGPSPRRTLHINNNLRRCSSTGTSEGPTLGNVNVDNEASEEEPVSEDRFKKNHCMQGSRATNFKASNKHSNNINTDRPPGPSKRSGNRRKREPNSFAGELVALLTRYFKVCLMWLVSLVTDVVVMSSRLTWQLFTTVVQWIQTKLRECWYKIIIKLKPRFARSGPFSWYNSSFSDQSSTLGLDQNIPLPSTGDEAMKRLLACKGKDPYSILGVTKDTSDEDIKKYYKRQAFLVHPDKNRQPGAEEAFKILAHAFELIGEPDKRNKYDSQMAEENVKENAWHEFSDLLSKLHDKMAEAVNTMKCDNCGSKHRRIPVDRPWYSARFCERCNVRHAVKEGDVWAESSFFGFLWYYYSCMDNVIYDITEWAACQKENFKHLQANAHHVRYRIVSGNGPHHTNPIPSDAELEEFLNQLYHQTVHGNRFCQSTGNATNGKPYGQQTGGNATNTNSKKKRKRKKN